MGIEKPMTNTRSNELKKIAKLFKTKKENDDETLGLKEHL